MNKDRFMFTCPLCGNEYQHGPHLYEGHNLKLYGIWVCNNCYEFNWDGWTSHNEEKLLKILKENGLPTPERN